MAQPAREAPKTKGLAPKEALTVPAPPRRSGPVWPLWVPTERGDDQRLRTACLGRVGLLPLAGASAVSPELATHFNWNRGYEEAQSPIIAALDGRLSVPAIPCLHPSVRVFEDASYLAFTVSMHMIFPLRLGPRVIIGQAACPCRNGRARFPPSWPNIWLHGPILPCWSLPMNIMS